MADLLPPASNGRPAASFRPGAAPNPTSSPSGIRGPRMIMQERAAREARQRAEAEQQLQMERSQAEQEARLIEEARRRNERRPAGVAAGQGTTERPESQSQRPGQQTSQIAPETSTARPRAATTTSHAPPQRPVRASSNPPQPAPQAFIGQTPVTQPGFGTQAGDASAQGTSSGSKPRNSFPHAFERWETLSAHWEGLTSYWIRKLEQNKDELNRDPLNQQLSRQVTDLSAAGANLFHAVVELQRLRASSERKFQRWFFETRAELERAQEVNAMMETALEQERRGRADAIREAVENERGSSKAQKQVAEMRKELAISKEEARRAWEELGRREQQERDRTLSLQSGQPTIVGGVQVVPMTQAGPSRQSSRAQGSYQTVDYGAFGSTNPPEQTTTPQGQPPASTTPGGTGAMYQQGQQPPQPPQQQPRQGAQGQYVPAGSEGGYSEGEYVVDANGDFLLDTQGNKIPFTAPPSAYSESDQGPEDYETPATTNPPSGKQESPSTSAGNSGQWTGAYSDPQDYTGQGYGAPGWETVPRHHHPTRLSDVMEEEEQSRTSASHSRV